MKLYVANCSTQMQTLNYRTSKDPKRGFATQNIGMARQEQIASDMDEETIKYVVEQQSIYGMIHVDDVERYRQFHVPLVYSIDKPVPNNVWQSVMERNKIVKRDEGAKLRRDAAIASSHGMREFSPNAADSLSVSVEEEKTGTMDHGGDQPLAEGYRMTREDVI